MGGFCVSGKQGCTVSLPGALKYTEIAAAISTIAKNSVWLKI